MAGLVLTGGGARAAYQAGALSAIADLLGGRHAGRTPFPIMAGVSAGAINAAYLAARADDFARGTVGLEQLWADLTPADVMRTDAGTLGALGARWMATLSLGGIGAHRPSQVTYLLDTRPLRETLERAIDFGWLHRLVNDGTMYGLCVSATNYQTGTAISFIEGDSAIELWSRTSRLGRRAELTLDHVLASASLPILFKPMKLGPAYYGDGGIRLHAPLSPAIHMGADRILAIGIRYRRPAQQTLLQVDEPMERISVADVAGVVLNAIFLDSLDTDLERMERINRTVRLLRAEDIARHRFPLRHIPVLALRPSQDLGTLASEEFHRFPWMLRHLLRGLGASDERGWDLVSYLAFDRTYTRRLIELGRKDVEARRDEIEAFFGAEGTPPVEVWWPGVQPSG